MNESVTQYWDKIREYWNQYSNKQKWMIIGTAVFIFLTLFLLIYHFSKTEYSLAYTDLEPADAASLMEYLDAQNIPYMLSNDGRSIGVPSKSVTEVKINAEAQNLIHNGSFGFGIFRDNISSFGMTDSQFNVLNTDAIAGEIQRLINGLSGVQRSNVLLSIPEQSVFLRTDGSDEASASVIIQSTHQLDQAQVDTMYSLVHRSVANLPLDNITISNQDHELVPTFRLTHQGDLTGSIATQQFEIRKRYETDIQRNIQSFLGQILGSDNVVVSVVAALNFDQVNSQETIFTPVNELDQQGIERSVQEIQRSYTGQGAAGPGGIPGTGPTDIPTYPGEDGAGISSSEEMERIVNYEINEITRSIVSSPYVVQDLTIFAGIEPPEVNNPESLSQETREEIHRTLVNIVSASLADSNRNFTADELQNKVSVITQSFRTEASQQLPSLSWMQYALYALAGLAALGLVGGGAYYIARKRRIASEEEIAQAEETEFYSVRDEIPSIDFESNENQVRKQLEMLAQKKPKEFVNLLRSWLAED